MPPDAHALRDRVREVLRRLKAALDNVEADEADVDSWEPLRFVMLSPLTHPADRLVADQALKVGYELHAVIPYERAAYEARFGDGDEAAEYRALVARAATVEELPGVGDTDEDRRDAEAAFEEWLLEETEVLLAVWAGDEESAVAAAAREAIAQERPVLWIDLNAPHETHRLRDYADGAWVLENLDTYLTRLSHYGL